MYRAYTRPPERSQENYAVGHKKGQDGEGSCFITSYCKIGEAVNILVV